MSVMLLNQSEYRHAHLFNTKLLMRRNVRAEEDSVVSMLQIKNPMAKRYFEFQLGRMHAVPLEKVRMYENGISKEGFGVCKDVTVHSPMSLS